ncbi:uncharacterized protein LOC110676441 [Aedes aegypti]|uniref:DDE-1 domain-containing protein n=1 Tax=Aedes aegypti TaxID=7159 RepID=A0A6I8U946_AEDAE|nr:uncharacterized protein LOC110676441 [Aedes aegypti]
MPRTYKKPFGSRPYANFSKETLEKAVLEIQKNNVSIRDAAQKYSLCPSTVSRHLKKEGGEKRVYGGQTVLSRQDEQTLVEGLLLAAEWGMPFQRSDLKSIVKGFLDDQARKENRFKDNTPGDDWCTFFLKRHTNLSNRLSENIKRSRAAVSKETICSYFENMKKSVKDVKPELIINYDETNLTDDPGRTKVIVRRGAKHAERILDSTKTSTSAMFAGTASGILLPPFVVYKSRFLYDTWTTGGPQHTVYGCSKSGWFDNDLFEKWFFKVALPHFKKHDPEDCQAPKILIGDNLASHLSMRVIQTCQEYNIRFVFLPPNSTHLCQPLDVAFFRPLKIKWRKVLLEYKAKFSGTVPKHLFPGLLKKTVERLDNAAVSLRSGFRTTGIYPLNPQQVLRKLPEARKETETGAEKSWSNAFVNVLKDARFGKSPDVAPARKKRILTEPGGVVTTEDLPQQIPVNSSSTVAKRTKKYKDDPMNEPAKKKKRNKDQQTTVSNAGPSKNKEKVKITMIKMF